MSIFQKEIGPTTYFDRMTVGGYSFDLTVKVNQKPGDPSAIHCGRIVYFEMLCGDEIAAYYSDGQWYINPGVYPEEDMFSDHFEEAASLAMEIFIGKWSRPERINLVDEATF